MSDPEHKTTVLFVCTGNTCRSPMAEGLLGHALGDRQDVGVSSAGLAAMNGEPASSHTLAILSEVGVDLSEHLSRATTEEIIDDSKLIVAISPNHKEMLEGLYPEASERIYLLLEFAEDPPTLDIRDPFGGTRKDYLAVRDAIVSAIPALVKFIDGL